MRDITLEKFNFIAGTKDKNEFYIDYLGKLKEILDSKETQSFEINEQLNNE